MCNVIMKHSCAKNYVKCSKFTLKHVEGKKNCLVCAGAGLCHNPKHNMNHACIPEGLKWHIHLINNLIQSYICMYVALPGIG